jgi:hypothetical protein
MAEADEASDPLSSSRDGTKDEQAVDRSIIATAAEGESSPITGTRTEVDDLQEVEREAKAILAWVQAVNGASEEGVLSRQVVSLDDLCDGVAFFDILAAV